MEANETELAVIAVSRTLFEVLIQKDLIPYGEIDRLLEIQQKGFAEKAQINAAGMIGTVRTLLKQKYGDKAGLH